MSLISVVLVTTVTLVTTVIIVIAVIIAGIVVIAIASIITVRSTLMSCKVPVKIKRSVATGLNNYEENRAMFLILLIVSDADSNIPRVER